MMKRLLAATIMAAALMIPVAVAAQDDADESMAPIGTTTFDVCLAISGPVIQITPEALTQGIADGTFVIEGLSSDCDDGLEAADDDDMDDDDDSSDDDMDDDDMDDDDSDDDDDDSSDD